MADQLGKINTQQRLISSGQRRPDPRVTTHHTVRHSEDSLIVNASEKRYLWTARAFAVVTAISICCNLILLLTIANILPLYRVEPYLITLTNKEDQVYNILPYSRDMEAKKSITETFVRQYVLLRTTLLPDIDEMESRWLGGGDLQEMSSDRVYTDFIKNNGTKLLQRMKEEGLTSSVKILTVNEVDEAVWQVEYSADYYLPSSVRPVTKKFRATLRIQYKSRPVHDKERLKNPVGFKVMSYGMKDITEKEKTE